MSKVFRAWKINEIWLLPPSVADFVPAGHPAHFIRDLVSDELDLSAIMGAYTEVKGYPPYHPAMMVALLLYAYRSGVYSSRRIARGCEERLDFQAVTALNQPDFRTISEFRRRHLDALAGLFVQVLALCRKAGLAGLEHVAVDGTKIKANASKHKAMSYARMSEAEADLAREVAEWLARAQAEDAAEDAAHGSTRRGDEPPDWMRDKQAGWPVSVLPRQSLKPKPGKPNDRHPRMSLTATPSGGVGEHPNIRLGSQSPKRSAISPTQKAGS